MSLTLNRGAGFHKLRQHMIIIIIMIVIIIYADLSRKGINTEWQKNFHSVMFSFWLTLVNQPSIILSDESYTLRLNCIFIPQQKFPSISLGRITGAANGSVSL